MVNLTRAEVAMLGRRREQPTPAAGELLAVFVSGPLRNPMNGSHGHWRKHARWAREWRDRACLVLNEWYLKHGVELGRGRHRDIYWPWDADAPKEIRFLAQTHNAVDDDNLAPMLKPIRDALKDMRVIQDDAPKYGHRFLYEQTIDRAQRGVVIRVRLR